MNDELQRISDEGPEPLKMTFPTGGVRSGSGELYAAIQRAGWDPVSRNRVTLRNGVGILPPGISSAGFTWSDSVGDIAPVRVDPSFLGADRRFLYPALKLVGVPANATSVNYLKQSARSLASTSDMIRDIDDVTSKPETSVTAELGSAELKQVANVATAVLAIASVLDG